MTAAWCVPAGGASQTHRGLQAETPPPLPDRHHHQRPGGLLKLLPGTATAPPRPFPRPDLWSLARPARPPSEVGSTAPGAAGSAVHGPEGAGRLGQGGHSCLPEAPAQAEAGAVAAPLSNRHPDPLIPAAGPGHPPAHCRTNP
ncbi:inverted formin-2-like [Kogia breviceps]|uniref:inverted formin-2-like n=1 Tax=Kogia breviceps TaxID=27615 RepID=UPI0034D1ED9B